MPSLTPLKVEWQKSTAPAALLVRETVIAGEGEGLALPDVLYSQLSRDPVKAARDAHLQKALGQGNVSLVSDAGRLTCRVIAAAGALDLLGKYTV